MTGFLNTAVGNSALSVNSGCYFYTAIRWAVFTANTSGQGKTAGGNVALFKNICSNNTAWVMVLVRSDYW